MKKLQYPIAALLLIAAIVLGMILPGTAAALQDKRMEDEQTEYTIEKVNLDYETDRTTGEKLAMYFSEKQYEVELQNGRYLQENAAVKICSDFLKTIFPDSGSFNAGTATPALTYFTDGSNMIVWNCSIDFLGINADFVVDDASQAILQFYINANYDLLNEMLLIGKSGSEDSTLPGTPEELTDRFTDALQENLQYSSASYKAASEENDVTYNTVYFGDGNNVDACVMLDFLSDSITFNCK